MSAIRTILSLYDLSGEWSKPYRRAGYDVIQMDKQLDGRDARLLQVNELPGTIHGILAAPECTMFANCGSKHKRTSAQMVEALSLVDLVFRLVVLYEPDWWVIEQPNGTLSRWLDMKPKRLVKMTFHPYQYAGYLKNPVQDAYNKLTILRGQFIKPIKRPYTGPGYRDYFPGWKELGGKSQKTKNARSKTPAGFARAFFESNR